MYIGTNKLFIVYICFFVLLLLNCANCSLREPDEDVKTVPPTLADPVTPAPGSCDASENDCSDQAERKNEKYLNYRKCKWGYEESCADGQWYQKPICTDEKSHRYFRTIEEKITAFWFDTDFGYVKKQKEHVYVCEPQNEDDSSFMCNKELTFCKGKNIYMDWRGSRSLPERFKKNPFESGEFGGHCKLHAGLLQDKNVYRGPLISWGDYINNFESLPFKPIEDDHCDVVVDDPTYILQIDSIGNMYHHFCDFFNLYVTQHINGSFSKDVEIAFWDPYRKPRLGSFADTWKVFTNRQPYSLGDRFGWKRVCFRDVIFAMLPRMAYGMYYSTPVIAGCSHSGLFKAFSKHVLNRLKITQDRKRMDEPLRITLLSRNTQWRKIINQDELVEDIKSFKNVVVKIVVYSMDMPFLDQLKITANSDIFIGMHGAGLAHALFLPNWAVLFELYNTDDINCYRDLARLRGVTYMTWEDNSKFKDETKTEERHPEYDGNAKFRNFRFDRKEFIRLMEVAVRKARSSLQSYFRI